MAKAPGSYLISLSKALTPNVRASDCSLSDVASLAHSWLVKHHIQYVHRSVLLLALNKSIKELVNVIQGEDTEGDHETEGDADASNTLARACRRSSNSLESLYSLNSGQSSSSRTLPLSSLFGSATNRLKRLNHSILILSVIAFWL